jgi:hypothetical protein
MSLDLYTDLCMCAPRRLQTLYAGENDTIHIFFLQWANIHIELSSTCVQNVKKLGFHFPG